LRAELLLRSCVAQTNTVGIHTAYNIRRRLAPHRVGVTAASVTQQRHGAGPLAQAPRVGRAQPLRHRRWSLRRLLRCEYSGRTVGMGRSLLAPLVALLYDAIALPYARLPHSEALRAALCPARLGSATSAVVRPRFATPMRRETPTHSSRVTCVGTELGVVDMRLANWGAFTVPLARPKLLSTQS
jgi:hypothetical protein